jgi:hypothetical protein
VGGWGIKESSFLTLRSRLRNRSTWRHTIISHTNFYWNRITVYDRVAQIFYKSKSHLKLLCTSWVTEVPYWGPTNIRRYRELAARMRTHGLWYTGNGSLTRMILRRLFNRLRQKSKWPINSMQISHTELGSLTTKINLNFKNSVPAALSTLSPSCSTNRLILYSANHTKHLIIPWGKKLRIV